MNKGRRLAAAGAILLLGLALRVGSWGESRFLEDEALYGYWGLQIASGADPMLDSEPVDKPPVQPYLLALSMMLTSPIGGSTIGPQHEMAARLPSLFASVSAIALVCALGDRWLGDARAGLLAALLLALSPFDILFASTAFTDSLMTALVLGSLLAAASGRLGAAGLMAGMAAATKQQGLFFIPVIVGAAFLSRREGAFHIQQEVAATNHRQSSTEVPKGAKRPLQATFALLKHLWGTPWLRFIASFALVAGVAVWWDASRLQRPGFFEQSLISYGGLELAQAGLLAERAVGWLQLLAGFWGSPWLGAVVVAGVVVWLMGSARFIASTEDPGRSDWLTLGFALLFVGLHWLFAFQLWDRYLLGLVPLLALLGGRAFAGLGRSIASQRGRQVYTVSLAIVFLLALVGPARTAARGEYPFGGDHGAYDGIDTLASYLRTEADPGSVVYHYWLGSHYRFYLHGQPLRLHWYPSLDDLTQDAYIYRRLPRYIAAPSWRCIEPARSALSEIGIRLELVFETTRRDGSTSFRLYRLVGP